MRSSKNNPPGPVLCARNATEKAAAPVLGAPGAPEEQSPLRVTIGESSVVDWNARTLMGVTAGFSERDPHHMMRVLDPGEGLL
jgi:hypothetical protein